MTGETQQNFALIGEAVVFLFSLPGRRCPAPPCFFTKTIGWELSWPPSPMRRQPKAEEAEERGQSEALLHPSIHLGQNLICGGFGRSNESGGGGGACRLQPSLAMHKTKC